jgi:hypothetical protein
VVLPFGPSILVLGAVQAATVAMPGAGLPSWLPRPRGVGWALIAPGSIAAVVIAIAQAPGVADGLTWLALIAVPPLAAAALGWAMRGARPPAALAAIALLAVACLTPGSLAGQACATALTALSCVTLGRLLAGITPGWALKAGIVVAAIVDTALIVSHQLQGPNDLLNAAVPAPHLPQLQVAALAGARTGYGDFFVAGLLGATLAAEGRDTVRAALLVLGFASVMDLLFLVTDELPATVPVAAALGVVELQGRIRAARVERRADVRPRARAAQSLRAGSHRSRRVEP